MKNSVGGYFPSDRGNLYFLNFADLPFSPKRVFVVNDVPPDEWRGGHAHYVCEQLLVCTKGSIYILIDTGSGDRETVILEPGESLYHGTLEWAELQYVDGGELLSICSHEYDPEDYINDYDLFLQQVEKG